MRKYRINTDKQSQKRACYRKGCDNTFFPLFKGEKITLCHICRNTQPPFDGQAA